MPHMEPVINHDTGNVDEKRVCVTKILIISNGGLSNHSTLEYIVTGINTTNQNA